MVARKRLETTVLQTFEEAALHLKEIGELELELRMIEADLDTKISDLRLEAQLKAEPLKEKIKRRERELKEFAEAHKAEFDKERTRETPFGQYGFRKGTKIIIPNPANTLALLHAKAMNDCIIVEERINREQLKQYSDDIVADVGATKQTTDSFWYEVNHETIQS